MVTSTSCFSLFFVSGVGTWGVQEESSGKSVLPQILLDLAVCSLVLMQRRLPDNAMNIHNSLQYLVC